MDEGTRARGELLGRRGDEGGQEVRDAGPPQGLARRFELLVRQARPVEVDPGEAVHLQVAEAGQLDPHCFMGAGGEDTTPTHGRPPPAPDALC